MQPIQLLLIVWICFVARAAVCCVVIPMWEGFDEPFHFAHLQNVALGGSRTQVPREVVQSFELVPLPKFLGYVGGRSLSHDQFNRLPEEQRTTRLTDVWQIAPQRPGEPAYGSLRSYEAQQPPLYYALFSPLYWLVETVPLPSRVLAIRISSALLASLVIPFGFLAARAAFGNEWHAVVTVALAGSMPELLLTVFRVSNDALAIAVGTALVWLTLRPRTNALLLGAVLGAALLTKAYFLSAFPVIAGVLLWRRQWQHAAAVILIATAVAGWYYAATYAQTGSVTGEQATIDALSLPLRIDKVDWRQAVDTVFVSHIWIGNWSFLTLRSWMYRVFLVLFAVAAVALAARRTAGVAIAAGFYSAFCSGLAYHVLVNTAVHGAPVTNGWYLYAMVIAECILLTAGMRWMAPILTTCFAAADMFGMVFYLLPYYSGLTAHTTAGAVRAARISDLKFLPHLDLMLVYAIATALIVVAAFRSTRYATDRRYPEIPESASAQ